MSVQRGRYGSREWRLSFEVRRSILRFGVLDFYLEIAW